MDSELFEITQNEQDLENEKALACALRMLARREHSCKELMTKLEQKKYSKEARESTLERCKKEGWISDERFAHEFVRFRFQFCYGPVKIEWELTRRGISDALVLDAMSYYKSKWDESASELFTRRFADLNLDDLKNRSKCIRYMQQRGFTHEQIKKIIRENRALPND